MLTAARYNLKKARRCGWQVSPSLARVWASLGGRIERSVHVWREGSSIKQPERNEKDAYESGGFDRVLLDQPLSTDSVWHMFLSAKRLH